MLSKEKFIEYMNFIKKMNESENRIQEVLQKEITDFRGGFLYSNYEFMYVKLLKEIMDDKNDWIEYFLYDLDFGAKWETGSVVEMDGTEMPLGTVENLYDLLIKYKN